MPQVDGLSLPPGSRRLRVYAFDPSLGVQAATASINELTIEVLWERDPATGRSKLRPGPIGEYIEVVDVDPASGVVYRPVDLNAPELLAQNGLAPSEGNPQFHQQMVYAVAMATIEHFERALGRVALWATHVVRNGDEVRYAYVPRLRIYPHALRDRNAYYSPAKKAVLFGYFTARDKNASNTPGTTVFACLAHDIVAHEVTHALLDGIHPRFNEPTNPDVLAFHEAFADVVALFQRFSYPGMLRDQIMRTRGDLESRNLLAQLAQQLGQATGRHGALRDALGKVDPATGAWRRIAPHPGILETTTEPHARGAVLVAAIFDVFVSVYRRRTADLFRIATQGTGVLPAGDIPPDLAGRLAEEASTVGRYVLTMCIRALDYCPPVDITFGAYLRAIITGDVELNPDDPLGYRVALIESFRAWGIVPFGVKSMSIEGLQFDTGAQVLAGSADLVATAGAVEGAPMRAIMRSHVGTLLRSEASGAGSGKGREDGRAAKLELPRFDPWNLDSDRYGVWRTMERNRYLARLWLMEGDGRPFTEAFGLVLDDSKAPRTVYRNAEGHPTVEVHSVRTALRRSTRGGTVGDLVVEIMQRRRGFFERGRQEAEDAAEGRFPQDQDGDFKYRAGCTVLIDPNSGEVRRVIRTAGTIADDGELERIRRFLTRTKGQSGNAFDQEQPRSLRDRAHDARDEPFALLHRHDED